MPLETVIMVSRSFLDKGYTHLRIRDDDYDGLTAEFIVERLETDEEYKSRVGAFYAIPESHRSYGNYHVDAWIWPNDWDSRWFKPGNRIRELQKAGALIAAEIDRLQRIKQKENEY